MPQDTEAFCEIEAHRVKIDELDQQIVGLLNQRAEQSLAIRALKPQANMGLYDPKREGQIIDRVCAYSQGPLTTEGLRELYATLLKVMKETPAQ